MPHTRKIGLCYSFKTIQITNTTMQSQNPISTQSLCLGNNILGIITAMQLVLFKVGSLLQHLFYIVKTIIFTMNCSRGQTRRVNFDEDCEHCQNSTIFTKNRRLVIASYNDINLVLEEWILVEINTNVHIQNARLTKNVKISLILKKNIYLIVGLMSYLSTKS